MPISKFYLHNATSPDTGTLPSGAYQNSQDVNGDATGARTAKDMNGTIGTAQASMSFSATANTSFQQWGTGRWASRPLGAQTIPFSGVWAFSGASSESNANHNQAYQIYIYAWRPSTGAIVGSFGFNRAFWSGGTLAEPGTTETLISGNSTAGSDLAINDGDILIVEVSDNFTQSMSSSYTSTIFYDGTTEASTTSCATFITPPSALLLSGEVAATPTPEPIILSRAAQRAATRCWKRLSNGIVVPKLWVPEGAVI